ncbi:MULTISPECIES: hypothetical protein [unclassified Janthinobacterium]|uniref:hypothetical protein n=1 Tax=unclassified Janthinobacterium TaxID=2610881 RepID=UPI00034C9C18|nr:MULTISPECIES: hypothetical protein [unclassified Janthinobacterium]MEC5161187.1 hypothetical protein [Janthinobacterium sp. CG_S6]
MLKRRLDLWLPSYIASAPQRAYQRIARAGRTTHILFLVCDHFEPKHSESPHPVSAEQAVRLVQAWHAGYASFQQRCRSAFGTAPLHTWFYPPHHGVEALASLAAMAHAGLGEVELHYHHDGDTDATLERDLRAVLAEYNRWGLLLESGAAPRTAFGFVHGDWALGNSGGGRFCGVNDELSILQKLGCWADLTMPSGEKYQTRKINSVYYGKGDPHRAKAHNWGPDARVGQRAAEGLMLIQGPLGINWGAPSYPRIENASLTSENWGRPDRIRKWIDCNVHVAGRPEWLFVKLHTHGAVERDLDALFGERAMRMHRTLNEHYNDGRRYRLHYVTARQAYNIAKAAEHGHSGDPADYLDFHIAEPATAHYTANARHVLGHCSAERLSIGAFEAGRLVQIRSRIGPFASLNGPIGAYEVDARQRRVRIEANGTVELWLRGDASAEVVEGAGAVLGNGPVRHLEVERYCVLGYR